MKKTGKYEKKPKAGDLLLQTYLTSMVSLILCVSMFLGTSYAWFTSEVTNTQNEIYVGTLEVGLYKLENGQPVDLATSENNTAKLFNSTIRWEPGYTALETIQITNEGDLAFRYELGFTDGSGKKGEDALTAEQLAEVADMFDIHVFTGTQYDSIHSYFELETSSEWKYIGTLKEVLEGKPVLTGNMVTVRQDDREDDPTTPNKTADGVKTVDQYTIALHMKESATAKVMGQRISLNVKLLAYQKAEEKDAFGNFGYYDTVTTVTNAKELSAAFEKGGIVSLATDIKAEGVETLAAINNGQSVELYLNGYDITATLAEDEDSNSTELFYVGKGGKLTIHGDDDSNIHVKAAESQKVSAVINNCGGTVVINGGNYSMEYGARENYLIPTIIDNNSTNGAATVTINGGTFKHGRNMFRNFSNNEVELAKLVINGGTFNGKDGEFENGTIWNQKTKETTFVGGAVELNGGTYNHMRICTGFGDTKDTSGVSIKGVGEQKWDPDGQEWIMSLSNISTEIN